MASADYEDPEIEERWCEDRLAEVIEHLAAVKVPHGRVGDWPAWHFAPYVSVWGIESADRPGWVGWWVIAGDLPTDHLAAETANHPRRAIRAFGERWSEVAAHMLRGEPHPAMTIGEPEDWPQLGDLLRRRAELLISFADDEAIWDGFD